VAPEEFESGGTHQAPEMFFGRACPSTFLALQVQLVVLVTTLKWWPVYSRPTVWSVSSLLFYTHGAPVPIHL